MANSARRGWLVGLMLLRGLHGGVLVKFTGDTHAFRRSSRQRHTRAPVRRQGILEAVLDLVLHGRRHPLRHGIRTPNPVAGPPRGHNSRLHPGVKGSGGFFVLQRISVLVGITDDRVIRDAPRPIRGLEHLPHKALPYGLRLIHRPARSRRSGHHPHLIRQRGMAGHLAFDHVEGVDPTSHIIGVDVDHAPLDFVEEHDALLQGRLMINLLNMLGRRNGLPQEVLHASAVRRLVVLEPFKGPLNGIRNSLEVLRGPPVRRILQKLPIHHPLVALLRLTCGRLHTFALEATEVSAFTALALAITFDVIREQL